MGQRHSSFVQSPQGIAFDGIEQWNCRCSRGHLLGLVLSLWLVSCSDNRVSQCNTLIEAINNTESTLTTITQTSTPDIDALKQIADITAQAGTILDQIELSNPQLRDFRRRFQGFYKNISTDAQTIVTAHNEQNMEKAEAAYQRLEITFQDQETLVNGVNQYCSESYSE